MKFACREDQNSDIVAAILNSTQQPSSVFVMSSRQRDFVQMASDKLFKVDENSFQYFQDLEFDGSL